jgi:type IV secretory pathway TrbD component
MRRRRQTASVHLKGRRVGANSITGDSVVGLVLRSGPAAKVVLLILLVFSVVSWGIILHKLWHLRRVQKQTATFRDIFRRSSKFSEVPHLR